MRDYKALFPQITGEGWMEVFGASLKVMADIYNVDTRQAMDSTAGVEALYLAQVYLLDKSGNVNFELDVNQALGEFQKAAQGQLSVRLDKFRPPFSFQRFEVSEPISCDAFPELQIIRWIFGFTTSLRKQDAISFFITLEGVNATKRQHELHPEFMKLKDGSWDFSVAQDGNLQKCFIAIFELSLYLCNAIRGRGKEFMKAMKKDIRETKKAAWATGGAPRPTIVRIFEPEKVYESKSDAGSGDTLKYKRFTESHLQVYWIAKKNADKRAEEWRQKGRQCEIVWELEKGDLVAMLLEKEEYVSGGDLPDRPHNRRILK